MVKAIESDLYRIEKAEDYDYEALRIVVKDTDESLVVYVSELEELLGLIDKSKGVLM